MNADGEKDNSVNQRSEKKSSKAMRITLRELMPSHIHNDPAPNKSTEQGDSRFG